MTTNHHTPWVDGVTIYEDSVMNAPLGELDEAIGDFSGQKGKIARVEDAEGKLEYFDSAYDVGGLYNSTPPSGAVLMRLPFVRTVVFPAGMSDSELIAEVAATSSAVFSLRKNGVQFGTATFAASGTSASFSVASDATFDAGDILTLVAPNPADATLADLGWCFAGTRNDYT